MRLQRVVAKGEPIGYELARDRSRGGRGQRKVGVCIAGVRDDVHAEPLRDAHDRPVLRKTVHEKSLHEPVACVRRGAFKQRAADAAAAVRRQNREPELGKIVPERHMRHANERIELSFRRSFTYMRSETGMRGRPRTQGR